jgi:protocatechuate 3,4-dioxygenase beta subunit
MYPLLSKFEVRRRLLGVLGVAPVWYSSLLRSAENAAELRPTRPCVDEHDLTPRQMEGPYFKPRSPQRTSLIEPQVKGTSVLLSGLVLSTSCKPVAGALLDFWQCDSEGNYDNTGNRLRGHQYTDQTGRYQLQTIVPGVYPGRTRHIHVKVQAPDRAMLTTQLYFPGEPRNSEDFLFTPELLVALKDAGDSRVARFDFVVRLS